MTQLQHKTLHDSVLAKNLGLTVNELYLNLKEMAVLYDILPGERINELEFAKKFGVSRSPLREALNRLVAENLLDFVPNKGFFVRKLDRQEVFEMYQLREIIEIGGIQLSIQTATDEQINEVDQFWNSVMERSDSLDAKELLGFDEEFHIRLIALSGNKELIRSLNSVNERIRFVRWIDLQSDRAERAYTEHKEIMEQLKLRDKDQVVHLLRAHIARRLEEITQILQAGVVQLYVT